MNNKSERNLYGDMGMLGGLITALPCFLIALFTKGWWFGVLGMVFFIWMFPLKEVVFLSKRNLTFGLLTFLLVIMSIYSTYSFLEWRGFVGYLMYWFLSFFWGGAYYFLTTK
ncbi:hypothetical protein [Shewanella sp. YLB-07]|uniref:hypothetical protein n=1 Tax=Shewanella sp. YLB-07 TaxID=2601268 RepID=UPI00128E3552|nr:hypothetical protein [Shewanella sp. YLB-07]MPY24438.1 hypothetical protein [Shewanella sp. YLB-07]